MRSVSGRSSAVSPNVAPRTTCARLPSYRDRDGERRIVSDPPLIVPIEELSRRRAWRLAEAVRQVFMSYRRTLMIDRRRLLERFRYEHVARKVVGIGSVGAQTWILLLLAAMTTIRFFSSSRSATVGARAVPRKERVQEPRSARRRGPTVTQAARDVLLAGTRRRRRREVPARLLRPQLWDGKATASIDAMTRDDGGVRRDLRLTLAHAHARSGDPVALASYLGSSEKFDSALASFAESTRPERARLRGARSRSSGGSITAESRLSLGQPGRGAVELRTTSFVASSTRIASIG